MRRLFGQRGEIDRDIANLRYEVNNLNRKYFELQRSHYALMKKLGLREVEVPAHTVFVEESTSSGL